MTTPPKAIYQIQKYIKQMSKDLTRKQGHFSIKRSVNHKSELKSRLKKQNKKHTTFPNKASKETGEKKQFIYDEHHLTLF